MGLWYKNAFIYAVDVEKFQDSNGDGIGDFPGLIGRLPYLADLGVTCVWLLPFFRSPNRDNGYDVEDYYSVDPRHGTLADAVDFIRKAGEHGIRVLIDLVVDHTSDTHPWFQAARHDTSSRFYSYYYWSKDPPPVELARQDSIFPSVEDTVWTFDPVAEAYYFHRFYNFQPQLNFANPQVVDEVHRVMDFWMSFGPLGFRIDAASHIIQTFDQASGLPVAPHRILREMRLFVESRRKDAILIGESDVPADELVAFFGEGDELNMLFNFLMSQYVFLALAQKEAEPVTRGLGLLPSVPESAQWANFLRNLDELDMERLTDEDRLKVYEAFAPEDTMRIYGRGVRRRLAPMLGGDPRRIRVAFSLLFSLPGTPAIVYGDEIGMGENLSLPERNAVRLPMQWSAEDHAGFSKGSGGNSPHVLSKGAFGYRKVNAAAQARDPKSLLNWMKGLIATRRKCPEFGWGVCHPVATSHPAVLALRTEWRGSHILTIHNLSDKVCTATLDLRHPRFADVMPLFGDARSELSGTRLKTKLEPYGFQWLSAALPRTE
jgi:maltose alpha-D-glucosyltransferase / alpha-amylase